MDDKYLDFNEKRMHIFNELVKRYWKGDLKSVDDLNDLAEYIKNKYGFNESDMPFIRNHIRLAMGQDPKGEKSFDDELSVLNSSMKIYQPVVSKLEGPCKQCNSIYCECNELGKYESGMYNRLNETISCGYSDFTCDFGAVADKIEFMPVIDLLRDGDSPVYVTVAPAIVGQFGEEISMGKLRSALKLLGFKDMIEVALFADILTIKEAYEFNDLVKSEDDFFLTSCCCPMWFNMIKKVYPDIYDYLSPSISPMIASGRVLKKLYNNAKVVFISPCVAKKGEIKEPDLQGAIDYVLNFRELKEIFDALNLDFSDLYDDDKDQASFGGRVYARTGGVSFSVKTVLNRLEPTRVIKLKSLKVNGIKECKRVLDSLKSRKKGDPNFIEGMGCVGGCVGGPKTNIDLEKATRLVNDFGEDSFILTPFDNQNVMKILDQFNVKSIQEFMENDELKEILSRE
ncbi:[Fe-Fe] hydrogenase large subunit C-terminal domain-containing protein [Gudongella sp. DL1XJH-153]|uniref:[Fe-Fe] hydrogenase large subunit C-terminal domain-containing protein n=1 Tax=Gudongella sp. DL1XJH-153 TaxID=3409804 RepID=UPI003BB73F52